MKPLSLTMAGETRTAYGWAKHLGISLHGKPLPMVASRSVLVSIVRTARFRRACRMAAKVILEPKPWMFTK